MKKSFLFVAAVAMTFAACQPNYDVEDKTVATFEEAAISPAEPESVFHLTETGTFTSGMYSFKQEVQDWGEYGVYYFGNIVSNKTDTKFESYLDAEKSAKGGAKGGKNFLVWAGGAMGDVNVTLSQAAVVPGMYVCNSVYAVDAIVNGDNMSDDGGKPFGEDDWFLLTVYGSLDGKSVNTTVEFYLAKGQNYVADWTYVDLSKLGKVDQVTFELTSSKKNNYGMTTPNYFCIDNFGAKK